MKLARIVSSNSHVEYIARVLDRLDVSEPPTPGTYGFGSFVSIESEDGEVVGVVFNSILLNPEYASFGPRLSGKEELASFSPDFLDEQGSLLAILLLGSAGGSGKANLQRIPFRVIAPGSEVSLIDEESFREFHTDSEGRLSLNYYSQVLAHTGTFGLPLLENIIERLSGLCESDAEVKRLAVLNKSLVWQRTVGQTRL